MKVSVSSFIENNLHIKVVRHPGDSNIIILGVGQRLTTSREEGESLYEADSEEQDLVPSQGLPHALPLTYTERYQGRMLLISEEATIKLRHQH